MFHFSVPRDARGFDTSDPLFACKSTSHANGIVGAHWGLQATPARAAPVRVVACLRHFAIEPWWRWQTSAKPLVKRCLIVFPTCGSPAGCNAQRPWGHSASTPKLLIHVAFGVAPSRRSDPLLSPTSKWTGNGGLFLRLPKPWTCLHEFVGRSDIVLCCEALIACGGSPGCKKRSLIAKAPERLLSGLMSPYRARNRTPRCQVTILRHGSWVGDGLTERVRATWRLQGLVFGALWGLGRKASPGARGQRVL